MAVIGADNLGVVLGGQEVLAGVSLAVDAGETLAVLGPSGCGKTTLLRALAGLLPPTSGSVQRPPGGVAVVFQDPRLLPWLRVEGNIQFALEAAKVPREQWPGRVRPLLEVVGLVGKERLWPSALSGGMAQRVALVRALATRPAALLLDEPFAALDPQRRELLQGELQALVAATRCATVVVTHDVTEALVLGDAVAVLGGRPGSVQAQVAVPAPRPRADAFRLSEEVLGLRRVIREKLTSSSGTASSDPSF